MNWLILKYSIPKSQIDFFFGGGGGGRGGEVFKKKCKKIILNKI